MAHFGTVCGLWDDLNRMPSIEPLVDRIQERLAIAPRDADRVRKNPGKFNSAGSSLEDGKERLNQLYDIVGIYAKAYGTSGQRQILNRVCEVADRMFFHREEILTLVAEIENVIREKAEREGPAAHS